MRRIGWVLLLEIVMSIAGLKTISAQNAAIPKFVLNGCEDPGWLLVTLRDRSDFVSLKLRRLEPGCFFIVEATAAVSRLFQPAIDGFQPIPSTRAIADLFKPSTLRLAT